MASTSMDDGAILKQKSPKRMLGAFVSSLTDQGSVDLYIREIGETGNGDIRLYFEVADTGIGIAPQDQQHLFQTFTQLDNQRSRRYSGSGLGLAISRNLVDAMGGKLELKSTPGQGSRFFFTLAFPIQTNVPVGVSLTNDSSGESLVGQAPTTATITGKHILLVDDDEMNQFFGHELLTRLGAETTVAGNGAEAIWQLRHHHFDLVLMDVSMPEMDGYETTRQIRTNPRFSELPIIALTAHAIAGEKERCLAAGMNAYLPKPVELTSLEHCIKRWIG